MRLTNHRHPASEFPNLQDRSVEIIVRVLARRRCDLRGTPVGCESALVPVEAFEEPALPDSAHCPPNQAVAVGLNFHAHANG